MPMNADRNRFSKVSGEKRMSMNGRPRKRKKSCTTSGVLRKNSTYAAPIQRRILRGETRMSATIVPRTIAPMRPRTLIWTVNQKPPKKSSGNSNAMAPGIRRQYATGAGHRPTPVRLSAKSGLLRSLLLVARHGRDVGLVDLAPGPVLDDPREPRVQERHEAVAVVGCVLLHTN